MGNGYTTYNRLTGIVLLYNDTGKNMTVDVLYTYLEYLL